MTMDAVQERSESPGKADVDSKIVALAPKMRVTARKHATTDGSLSGSTEEKYFAVQAGQNKGGKESWSSGYIGWWANDADCKAQKDPESTIKLTKISAAKADGKTVRVKYKDGDDSGELGVVFSSDEEAAEWA